MPYITKKLTNLQNGVEYQIKVAAINSNGVGQYTDLRSAIPQSLPQTSYLSSSTTNEISGPGAGNFCAGIVYGSNKYVQILVTRDSETIGTTRSEVFVSTDGNNWTKSATLNNVYIRKLIYENNTFVAIGTKRVTTNLSRQFLFDSSDAISWTERSLYSVYDPNNPSCSVGTEWGDITYGYDNKFYITYDGTSSIVFDGSQLIASCSNTYGLGGVGLPGEIIPAVDLGSTVLGMPRKWDYQVFNSLPLSIQQSWGGYEWERAPVFSKSKAPASTWQYIGTAPFVRNFIAFQSSSFMAYNGTTIVAIGSGALYYSLDGGYTWNRSIVIRELYANKGNTCLIYDNSIGMFVLSTATLNDGTDNTEGEVALSPNGVNWVASTIPNFNSVAANGKIIINNFDIVPNSDKQLITAYTIDGANATLASLPDPNATTNLPDPNSTVSKPSPIIPSVTDIGLSGSEKLKVSWVNPTNNGSDITEFKIEYFKNTESSWQTLDTIVLQNPSVDGASGKLFTRGISTTLSNGTYFIRASAKNSAGYGDFSPTIPQFTVSNGKISNISTLELSADTVGTNPSTGVSSNFATFRVSASSRPSVVVQSSRDALFGVTETWTNIIPSFGNPGPSIAFNSSTNRWDISMSFSGIIGVIRFIVTLGPKTIYSDPVGKISV
jgi:hypothetical protein